MGSYKIIVLTLYQAILGKFINIFSCIVLILVYVLDAVFALDCHLGSNVEATASLLVYYQKIFLDPKAVCMPS